MKAKHWVFTHFTWVALGLVVLELLACIWIRPRTFQDWLGLAGIPAIFLITVLKQKREELELFERLFAGFNKRYEELRDLLKPIYLADDDVPLSPGEIDILERYFNLCGEEFLFYRQGYIYPEVWEAWYAGMKVFHSRRRIREFWEDELSGGSYYGFRFVGTSAVRERLPVDAAWSVAGGGALGRRGR